MQEYSPPVASVSLPLNQCGHADEVTCQADDVRSLGVKRTLRSRATTSGNAPQADVGREIDRQEFPYQHCYRPRNPRCVLERTHIQLQKVNFGDLQFEPTAVARMRQLTFIYRVEWAGRFVREDAPDGTTAV
jgi:hypothetical protein